MNIVRVALDVPLAKLFDYRADDAGTADIGKRVVVPFGKRQVVGIIMQLAHDSSLAPDKIKQIAHLFRDEPGLPGDTLDLLQFCSEYYHHPLGATVLNALPTPLRRARPLPSIREPVYRLSIAAQAIGEEILPARATLKRKLWAALRQYGVLDKKTLLAISPRATALLKEFVAQGWAEEIFHEPQGVPHAVDLSDAIALTNEQEQAVHTVSGKFGQFQPWLLYGVTGSGKTEVYLRLTAEALRHGKQVLLLLPEINLTPQFEARLRERLPAAQVISLHSGLNDGERTAGWLRAQNGTADIVLGTRLAVFTPLPRLGLIVVDEEHDASFKQHEGLRYSARDLAVYRAKQRGVPIVLGSATPSLESYYKVKTGQYQALALTRRVNCPMPTVRCIDARADPPKDGLSRALIDAIAARLQRQEQSLIFINRRGYAPVLLCHACGWAAPCHRCSTRLVLHLKDRRLHCHHCGHQERVPTVCPDCGNADLAPLGHGTQRIESVISNCFPQARLLRIDRDSTRRKEAWADMRRQIHDRDVDILIGTQMLAKGHDFPALTLVGVLNADQSLYSTDFRASERLFAQLVQVAGRAGRDRIAGEVLVQTEFPHHPLFLALQQHDYAQFAELLLNERRQADFPPYVHQAVLHAEANQGEAAFDLLHQAARIGKRLNTDQAVTLYDPIAAPVARLAGKARAQLLLQCPSRVQLQQFLHAWYGELQGLPHTKARWYLDVDPLEF